MMQTYCSNSMSMLRRNQIFSFRRMIFGSSSLNRQRKVLVEMTDDEYETYLTKKPSKNKVKKITKTPIIEKESLQTELDSLKFKKVGTTNAIDVFGRLMHSMKQKTFRKDNDLSLISGQKSIIKAFNFKNFIKTIYFTNLSILKDLPIKKLEKVNLICVPKKMMENYDDMLQSPISALISVPNMKQNEEMFKIINHQRTESKKSSLPLSIVCCDIKNPFELAHVIKYAAKTCCKMVYVMNTCADPWDPLVMRASENAHLQISVMSNVTWDNLKINKSTKVFALTNRNVVGEKYNRLKSLHGSFIEEIDEDGTRLKEESETSYHDVIWCSKSEYLIMCGSAVTRNLKSFVADNKFEEFQMITHPGDKEDDLCVSLLVGSTLMEAKRKILSEKKS